MNRRRLAIVLLMVLAGTACLSQSPAAETLAAVTSTGTFVIPTSTPGCQHNNAVTLKIRRVSDTQVTLLISGLQPGEVPYITYFASQGANARGGTADIVVKGADTRGEFTTDLSGLHPLEGETSTTWDIRVIHSCGVERAKITLP